MSEDDSISGILSDHGVAGLGLDVIVTLIFSLGIGFIIIWQCSRSLYRYQFWNRGGDVIHPELVENVNELRENAPARMARQAERMRLAQEEPNHTCPICLGPAAFPVMTDCGHVYCCTCIIAYWKHTQLILDAVKCAICRTEVHMLLPIMWPSQSDENENDLLHESNIMMDDYNRRFSKKRPISEYLKDIPVLIPYVIRNIFDFENFTWAYVRTSNMISIVLIICYILLPQDVIPESIHGIVGLIDDAFALVLLVIYIIKRLRDHMAQRGMANNNADD